MVYNNLPDDPIRCDELVGVFVGTVVHKIIIN